MCFWSNIYEEFRNWNEDGFLKQTWVEASERGGSEHTKEGQLAFVTMHTPYVPHSSALAREDQLQRVLEGKDRNNKLQLQIELHPVDSRSSAPKSQQCHSSF